MKKKSQKKLRYDPARDRKVPRGREEIDRIVEAMRLLGDPAVDTLAEWLEDVNVELLKRNPPRKHAPAQRKQVTSAMVRGVKEELRRHPHKPIDEIAQSFGTNPGRISEIIQGQRTEAYPAGTPEWRGISPAKPKTKS